MSGYWTGGSENDAPRRIMLPRTERALRFAPEKAEDDTEHSLGPWKRTYQWHQTKKTATTLDGGNHLTMMHDRAGKPYMTFLYNNDVIGEICQATVFCLLVHNTIVRGTEWNGTAFAIGPNQLCTARHNVRPTKDDVPAHLTFLFRANDISIAGRSDGKSCELAYCDDTHDLSDNLLHLAADKGRDCNPISGGRLKYQDDVALLESKSALKSFLLPGMPSLSSTPAENLGNAPSGVKDDSASFVLAVGYPGAANLARDKEIALESVNSAELLKLKVTNRDAYDRQLGLLVGTALRFAASHMPLRRRGADQFRKIFPAETMCMAPGRVLETNGRIAAHDCTSFVGFSGGPVISLLHHQILLGIHVGGGLDTADSWRNGHNLCVSTAHPFFANMYVKEVLKHVLSSLEMSARPFKSGTLFEFKRWLQHLDADLATDEHVVRALALLQDIQ